MKICMSITQDAETGTIRSRWDCEFYNNRGKCSRGKELPKKEYYNNSCSFSSQGHDETCETEKSFPLKITYIKRPKNCKINNLIHSRFTGY